MPPDPKQQASAASPQATPTQTAQGMQFALADKSKLIRTMAKDMAALSGAGKQAHKKPKEVAVASSPVSQQSMPARKKDGKDRVPLPDTQPKEEQAYGIGLPKRETPFFEKPQSREQRESEESVALPSLAEAGSIVSAGVPDATPREPELVPIQKPSFQAIPRTSTAPSPEPQPEPVEEKRASVLDRLRQRASDSQRDDTAPKANRTEPEQLARPEPAPEPVAPGAPAEPAPAQIPVPAPAPSPAPEPAPPPPPAWQNVPAPRPDFMPLAKQPQPAQEAAPAPATPPGMMGIADASDRYREPIESAPVPRPIPAAPLPDQDRIAPKVASPAPFHSYSSDFANRIDTREASAFSVLAAEQDSGKRAAAAPPQPPRARRAVIAVASGVLLLVLGAGGVFGAYALVMQMRDTPLAALTVPSIVHADEYRKLEGSGSALVSALAASANAALLPGNVLVTYIMTPASGDNGALIEAPAGADAILRAAGIPAPDILLRNVAPESSAGAISADGRTTPFFALRVNSYERTFAGMLTWEPLMVRDLQALYPLYPAAVPEEPAVSLDELATTSATSTASSTTTSALPVASEGPAPALTRFSDSIVANRDVRILRDTRGRALIVYGYADKRTLLIARDEAAFEALLSRLKTD